jgi:YVTN family beta-propeller protein
MIANLAGDSGQILDYHLAEFLQYHVLGLALQTNKTMSLKHNLILAAALFSGSYTFAQSNPNYKLIEKISLPGEGKWDYLKMDGEAERLFVSHFDKVHVIDLKTNKPVGEIDGLSGVHGIALDKKREKGYISNGVSNTVTVFDRNTFKVLKTISLKAVKPDCIIYDKASDKIYAFNGGSSNASVIDPATDEVVGTIELGGKPEFAVSDGKGLIYNNLEDKSEVVVIDVKQAKVIRRYKLENGTAPTGITMDEDNKRLFVACEESKNLIVLDATNGKKIAELPIGDKVDAVVFDKDAKLVITSNGEGNATIIHENSANDFKVVQTLQTLPGLKTLVHRGTTHRIYLSGTSEGSFGVFVYGPAK